MNNFVYNTCHVGTYKIKLQVGYGPAMSVGTAWICLGTSTFQLQLLVWPTRVLSVAMSFYAILWVGFVCYLCNIFLFCFWV